jgi:dGTP triphosphohydrolase
VLRLLDKPTAPAVLPAVSQRDVPPGNRVELELAEQEVLDRAELTYFWRHLILAACRTRLKREELAAMLGGNEQFVQDFLLFEGNAQTLRIVGKLQILADFHVLNLTFGTLSGLCKYTAASRGKLRLDHGGPVRR